MKKLATAMFGALFAGLMTGSVASQNDATSDAVREARLQKLNSVTESTPVYFSKCQQEAPSSVQWHRSHYSHSSHRSHYSHRSGY